MHQKFGNRFCLGPTTAISGVAHQHAVKLQRRNSIWVRHGARLAVVLNRGSAERLPTARAKRGAELHRVGAIRQPGTDGDRMGSAATQVGQQA